MTGAPRPANVHAPRRGRSARLLGPLHVTGAFWYRLHHWAARHVPEWTIRPLILAFTAFFFVALRRIGRNVRDNLVPVLGPAGFLAGRRRVHLVREEELDPEAQAFVRELLERRSGDLMETHFAGDPLLATDLAAALGRGDVVALQGDRPRAGGRAIAVELCGRPFELPVGPLALARAAGAPLLPVFAFREGRRRYRVAFRDPIRVAATDDRRADLRRAAERVAAELEWAIRRVPHQWFCFGRAWAQDAEGTKKTLSSPATSAAPSSEAKTS